MNTPYQELQNLISDTLDHIRLCAVDKKDIIISGDNYAFFAKTPLPAPLVEKEPTPIFIKPLENQIKKPSLPPKDKVVIAPIKEEKTSQAISAPAITPKAFPLKFSEEIKRQVQKILPHVVIKNDIPNDDEAKILSEEYKQPTRAAKILILSFSKNEKLDLFLQNVKKAIESHFDSCAIIDAKKWENKNEWDAFFAMHKPSLIITSPDIFSSKNLLPLYRENGATKDKVLNDIPLMMLSVLSSYLLSTEHKKTLWIALCNLLKKNQ